MKGTSLAGMFLAVAGLTCTLCGAASIMAPPDNVAIENKARVIARWDAASQVRRQIEYGGQHGQTIAVKVDMKEAYRRAAEAMDEINVGLGTGFMVVGMPFVAAGIGLIVFKPKLEQGG